MPSTRLTFVCQGSSRAMRSAVFGADDGLDEIGRRQAPALKTVLGPVDRVWSSPAACARQTADAIGLHAGTQQALADCDYGRWTGLPFRTVLLREPRRLVRWLRSPRSAPHGGETVPELIGRVGAWLEGTLRTPGHTVAITHAAVIRAAVVHVLAADAVSFWKVDILPLSRTELRSDGRRWVLRMLAPFEQPGGDG